MKKNRWQKQKNEQKKLKNETYELLEYNYSILQIAEKYWGIDSERQKFIIKILDEELEIIHVATKGDIIVD